MTSETLRPSITLAKQNQPKPFNIDYWQVAMTAIFVLTVACYILSLISGAATIILCAAIVLISALKPVYDILNADFDISLENLELKNVHEELWD